MAAEGDQRAWTPTFWRVLVFGCIGMALFGYDTGVVSGSLIMVSSDFELDTFRKEFAVSVTVLFAAVGSVAGAPLNDTYGRKPVVSTSAVLYIIGSVIIALSGGYRGFIMGRALLGIAIGFASGAVPPYTAELSPPTQRGMVVTLNALNIVLGQLLAGIINALVVDHDGGWRIAMGFAALPATVMLVGAIFLPESPRWLAQKGRLDEAEAVVRSVCGDGAQAEAEIAAIRDEAAAAAALGGGQHFWARLRRLWTERELRRAVLLGIGLMALNQLSGINTVMYYSATVLVGAGFSARVAVWIAAVSCLAQLLGVCLSVYTMDRHGRRLTALRSAAAVTISLLLLSSCFYLTNPDDLGDGLTLKQRLSVASHDKLFTHLYRAEPPGGPSEMPNRIGQCVASCKALAASGVEGSHAACRAACELRDARVSVERSSPGAFSVGDVTSRPPDESPTPLQAATVVSLMLYLVAFGAGLGGVPWVVGAEIYPTDVRSTAVGQNTLSNWLFNFIVAQTFLDLVQLLHSYGAFLVYACFSAVGGLWLYFYLPETMHLSLEQIAALFHDPYPAPLRGQQQRLERQALAPPSKRESDKLLPR